MTFIPPVNNWAWNLLGADAVFFSQPTEAWSGERLFSSACIARCTSRTRLQDEFGTWTYEVQCGHVARHTADGLYCLVCRALLRACPHCGTAGAQDDAGHQCEAGEPQEER